MIHKLYCGVQEKIRTHPVEGHWKFLGGEGVLEAKILEVKYEANWNFLRWEGVQNKNLL